MENKPIIVSNFNENAHLGISVVSCRLFDLMALDQEKYKEYTEPIYTKLDGMYGYLTVNGFKVYFIWYNNSSENVNCDDVSEKFRVEYVSVNGN